MSVSPSGISPRSSAPEVGGALLELLHELQTGRAFRLSDVQARRQIFTSGVESGHLRVVKGLLGPLVVLGPAGLRTLGLTSRPLTASTATEHVALREAALLGVTKGYAVTDVASRYLRLTDTKGREHLLYVCVSRGAPLPVTVAELIRSHRQTLRRSGGTLILYTLDPARYRTQLKYRSDLQVWGPDGAGLDGVGGVQ